MTKREVFEKFQLDLNGQNFDPNEEADDEFIAGCVELHRFRCEMETSKIEIIRKIMVDEYGEETAEYRLRIAFLAALADLIDHDIYPFWVGIAVAELFDNNCSVLAVLRAIDKVNDYMMRIRREEKDHD